MAAIFSFVDAHPAEPIMVHCVAGLSRSPAVALALIVRGLVPRGADPAHRTPLVERAVDLLLRIRPHSRPNVLVLQLGLEQFLKRDVAQVLTLDLSNHPVLRQNRLVKDG